MIGFPVDLIPDGHPFAPHHLYWASFGALLVLLTMWDNRRADPWVAAGALVTVLFAFGSIWPFYHDFGAAVTLAGLTMALGAPLRRSYWSGVGRRRTALYILFVLAALDDAVEHALGVWTPLDWLFNQYVIHLIT